jgi:hypothetical protein
MQTLSIAQQPIVNDIPFFMNEEEPMIINPTILNQHEPTKETMYQYNISEFFEHTYNDDIIFTNHLPQEIKTFTEYVNQDIYFEDSSLTYLEDMSREILLATES